MLLVDIGNSRVKGGVWQAGRISTLEPRFWRDAEPDALFEEWLGNVPAMPVLASNVGGTAIGDALAAWGRSRWQTAVRFAHVMQDFAGMHTRYEQPTRLGIDRWLAALAAHRRVEGTVCVIDSGTALTADIVTADGEHLGGLIAPGLGLMARSLTQGTAHLSLEGVQLVDRIATNTVQAISLGCQEAVAGLIERLSSRLAREVPGAVQWFVAGGEAAQIAAFSPVPMTLAPDLVLEGLAVFGELDA